MLDFLLRTSRYFFSQLFGFVATNMTRFDNGEEPDLLELSRVLKEAVNKTRKEIDVGTVGLHKRRAAARPPAHEA